MHMHTYTHTQCHKNTLKYLHNNKVTVLQQNINLHPVTPKAIF